MAAADASALASAVSAATTRGRGRLVVLDPGGDDWHAYPWGEVHETATRVATALVRRPDPGAPVGIVGDVLMETVAAVLGAWLAGVPVTVAPGPHRSRGSRGGPDTGWGTRIRERMTELGVPTLFAHGDLLATLDDEHGPGSAIDLREVRTWETEGEPTPAATATRAVLQGTAGSTGSPRTAVISPDAVLANTTSLSRRMETDPDVDVHCSWLPLYHDMGLILLATSMVHGHDTWLAPTSAFVASPFSWLDWLHTSRATSTAAPNFAYNVIGHYSRRTGADVDLSRLRYAINGGEPVDVGGIERFTERAAAHGLSPTAVAPGYGAAELTCGVSLTEPGQGLVTDDVVLDGRVRRQPLCGRPLDDVELRLAPTDTRTELDEVRDVGEIELRSPSMMDGYLGVAPERRDGWLATGDLGYVCDGNLVVCGRSKELITLAGRNVFPTEVERCAGTVEGVRSSGVVAVGTRRGTGSARDGSELVVVAEFRGTDPDTARRRIADKVAVECGVVPSKVDLVEPGAVPKTTSGKLRRLQVRSWYE